MNKRFIYVFSQEEKDRLLQYGFQLIKSDDEQNIFIFANNKHLDFSAEHIDVFYSNTLTF